MLDQRLRKLELTGFKTFARRTELLLPGGLTGIVGPNGSGKSNLADALRWALGEQSLQHIRSKKTEDVIFAGAANRSPVGMAEVTLTLDNTSGWIPLDFSEVTLTRRAYRSGDNEYFINNARVRLRDIVDLRSRAGFGQSSYSVIGQGLVDSVLSQRPDERRSLFEEAAGIRHYQAKRDQALDQLLGAQQNLVRVQDILAEIEPRLEALRRQSERARQHAQLSDELRTLQIRWYAARQHLLRRQLADATSLAGEAQRELDSLAEQSTQLGKEAAALEAEKRTLEQRLAEQSRTLDELQRRSEQLDGQKSLAADKLQFMQQQGADAERELAEVSASQAALRQQQDQLEGELVQLRERDAALKDQMRSAEQRAAEQAASLRGAELRVQEAREALAQTGSARRQQEREIADLAARHADLLRQAEQHGEDAKRKQGLAKALAEKQAALQAELLRLRGDEERLSGKIEDARMALTAAAAELSGKESEVAELRRAHGELATRLALLQELQTNLEGLAEGTRALMRTGSPGVLGALADGLTVKPGYERAIAAALGHKLDAVLVESDAAALSILAGDIAEATLMVSPAAAAGSQPAPVIDGLEAATHVIDNASAEIARLLAATAIARDLNAAFEARRQGWRAVTLAGDLVEVDGTVTRRGPTSGEAVLKRQKSIEDLQVRVQASAQEVGGGEQAVQELADRAGNLRHELAQLEEEGRKRAAERQHTAAEVRDFAQQLDAAQAQIDWLSNLQRQAQEQARNLETRRLALVAELDQSATSQSRLQSELQQRELELAATHESGQAETERLGELRLELGVARQRLQHLQGQRADLDQQLASLDRQVVARQKRAQEQAGMAAQLQCEIAGASSALDGVQEQLAALEAELPPLRNSLSALTQQAHGLRQTETSLHEQHSELDKRSYRLTFDRQRKQEELEALAIALMEDLQLTLDVLPDPDPQAPEPSKREVDALKARLAGLGPINPGALDEFEEVAQRHQFLTTQKADLEGAAQQLRTVIAELEELTRRQFLETFEQVSQQFSRFFGLMFEGGEVQIFLTNPESVQTTGVDILAQPPGKRLQALPLLSGGERALVASALLFAILSVKPVPFCLLDEVDAALDEANVKRFCQALKSLAIQTQFIVITHNRETMAVADALYGVSMSQDGVSRLVSLRLPKEDGWEEDGEEASEEELQVAG